jgi:hypothetical protein
VRARISAAALVVALAIGTVAAADESGPWAEGTLAWIDSDRLDLVGTVAAELPLFEAGRFRVFASLGTVTALEKSTSEFTFLVDQVTYSARFGARLPLDRHGAFEVFAGELGSVLVDAEGRARVRAAGAAWESENFHQASRAFGWAGRVWLAAVVEDSGVDASAAAGGTVRFVGRLSESGKVAFCAEATVDALLGQDSGADLTIGPRLELDLGGDRRFGIFLDWLQGGNPLGLNEDGLMAGFGFTEGVHPEGSRIVPPEIAGLAAAGAGTGARALARLDIRVLTPPFLSGTYGEVEVDGSVLTADDANDLFYVYDVGVAHPIGSWRAGLWFHHRSNHVVDAPNPTVTSINVLEPGLESAGWNRAEPSIPFFRAGAIDAQLRAGWLIDSAFGEDTDWHARFGLRWASPPMGSVRIYAQAGLERGDVSGSAYAIGLLLPRGWDARVEARHDEQLFSADRRANLAIATLRY